MTMPEAFKCEGNDSPFIDGEFNSDKDFTKKGLLELSEYDGFKPWPSPKNQLSDQWQVQKAEPKVLTAEQIVDSVNNEYVKIREEDFLTYITAIQIAKLGQENGRLERDLELRLLAVCIGDNIENLINDEYECIVEYYKNLKPLNNG